MSPRPNERPTALAATEYVVRVYPRETQEMVFDAHDRAFALFKAACGRGIYDNMKTAVESRSDVPAPRRSMGDGRVQMEKSAPLASRRN